MSGGVTLESVEASNEEVRATFRIVGDNVDPVTITSRIGIQPSKAHIKGSTMTKHPSLVYSTGYWGIDSTVPSDRPLEEHLSYLLDLLEPRALLIKEFKEAGFTMGLYCGFFTSDVGLGSIIELEPDILRRITNIDISLELHIYCCDEVG